ncbi:MAG: hypothetical protein LBB50_07090 [Oscillospiraceae bacterium]|nr:hypothetical protein [Oscillospiraceae bacterium]
MQQTAQTARALAAQLLVQCEQRRSYANLALDSALKKARFLHADAAFCTALVYGVVERRRTLDFQAADLLRQPLQKLPPATRAALRLGLYQLFYMDRIPDHAAIGESVELVKNLPQARHTAGLVNAVLRRARERGLQLPAGSDDEALAVRYACPAWLVRLWRESYPEDYIALLAGSFGTGETVLRVNTTRTTPAALLAALPNETGARGVAPCPKPFNCAAPT